MQSTIGELILQTCTASTVRARIGPRRTPSVGLALEDYRSPGTATNSLPRPITRTTPMSAEGSDHAQTPVPREAFSTRLAGVPAGPCVVMDKPRCKDHQPPPFPPLPSIHQFPCPHGWDRVTFSRVARLSPICARVCGVCPARCWVCDAAARATLLPSLPHERQLKRMRARRRGSTPPSPPAEVDPCPRLRCLCLRLPGTSDAGSHRSCSRDTTSHPRAGEKSRDPSNWVQQLATSQRLRNLLGLRTTITLAPYPKQATGTNRLRCVDRSRNPMIWLPT